MAGSPQSKARKVPLPSTFRAFRDRNYRLLWPANFISYAARWMQMTLLGWMVLELTDSPWQVSLVGFFGFAPLLILGLFGGVLADSADRRRLLVSTQTGSFVAALVMTALLTSGAVQFWHAYVIMFLIGIAWALDMPSRRSAIYDLFGASGGTNAIALDSLAMSASLALGPALAGTIIALADVTGGYVIVTLFYLISALLLSRTSLPVSTRRGERSASVGGDLVLGVRYVVGHRVLLATVLITILMNMLMFPYQHMVPVIARDVLRVGPGLMGILQASVGLGSMVGAVAVASAVNIRYHGRLHMGGSMVALVCLLFFSFSRWYPLSVITLLSLGVGSAGFTTMQATLVILVSKEEMRGKALGVISLAIGTAPLGALIIGGVASLLGPTYAVGLNAAIGLALLALIGVFMPAIRQRIVADERRVSVPGA